MFSKNLFVIECRAFNEVYKSHNRTNILLVWGLLCLFMLAFLGYAFVEFGEESESSDFSLLEANLSLSRMGYALMQSSLTSFLPGVFALVLFVEFLRSHIGEKCPPEWIIELDNSFFAGNFLRRHYCIVPSLLYVLVPVNLEQMNKND